MIVVVPVDPPRAGLVCSELVAQTPLSPADAAYLYEAATVDVLRSVRASGGDLLINYRDEETLPVVVGPEGEGVAEDEGDGTPPTNPEAEIRALAARALEGTDEIRFERQVGSTRAARVGNTVTHLLEQEDAASVGILEPAAAGIERTHIDGAAMSIRRNDVVLGPGPSGSAYFTAFSEPIDFTDFDTTPELATLAGRCEDAGLEVGLAPMLPTIASETGLCSTIALCEARRVAGRGGLEATAAAIDELGLVVRDGEEKPGVGLES